MKDAELRKSAQRMFVLNSQFHETIAAFSNNTFIIQATQQQSRLRQLSETYLMDLERTRVRLAEHISIMEALRRDEREWAAHLLRRHLEVASHLKPPFAETN
jgi:DNA-binding GntR family transcriptional regulator